MVCLMKPMFRLCLLIYFVCKFVHLTRLTCKRLMAAGGMHFYFFVLNERF